MSATIFHQAILIMAAVSSDHAADLLVRGSPLCDVVTERLARLYMAVPQDIEPHRLEDFRSENS